MYVNDASETPALALQRYDPPLVFTEALMTAHALADQQTMAAWPASSLRS
jgi:hypothetical protein